MNERFQWNFARFRLASQGRFHGPGCKCNSLFQSSQSWISCWIRWMSGNLIYPYHCYSLSCLILTISKVPLSRREPRGQDYLAERFQAWPIFSPRQARVSSQFLQHCSPNCWFPKSRSVPLSQKLSRGLRVIKILSLTMHANFSIYHWNILQSFRLYPPPCLLFNEVKGWNTKFLEQVRAEQICMRFENLQHLHNRRIYIQRDNKTYKNEITWAPARTCSTRYLTTISAIFPRMSTDSLGYL